MYKHLTQFELYYVWQHCVNKSVSEILCNELRVIEVAANLGFHRSTIYRAINYLKATKWEPIGICGLHKFRKRKSNRYKKINHKVKSYIISKLKIGWSPEIISGRISRDIRCRISF